MNVDELTDYLIGLKLLSSPEISFLGKGESNINYLATDGNAKYVIRTTRGDMPGGSRFEAEHHFMLFIEAHGIEFAPRSVHYDEEQDIHIVSYVEGKDASVADLTVEQTKLFIEQLKRLDSIAYNDYLTWCMKAGQLPRSPQTLATRKKVNVEDRLYTIDDASSSNSFAQEVVSWAAPKVEVLDSAEKEASLKTVFLHNDLRWTDYGGNLKISGERLYYIDWELSGFFADAVPEIGDVIGSIPYTAANKPKLRRLYEYYSAEESDREQLDKSIRYGVLWGKLNNPLWAAERYFILARDDHSEVERYRLLAEDGMKDAERFFGAPFEQWFI